VATEIKLTGVAGEYMDSAVVIQWLKEEGQPVDAGEPLVVVETAKATVELPSPTSGILERILVAVGQEALLGAALGLIAQAQAAAPSVGRADAAPDPTSPRTGAATPASAGRIGSKGSREAHPPKTGFVPATPRARVLANQLGIDLAAVRGSGPDGAVTEGDVQRAAGAGPARPAGHERVPHTVEQPTGYRPAAAVHMTRSLEIPQFSISMSFDAEPLEAARVRCREQAGGADAPTITDFIVKAAAAALKRFPRVNAQWDNGRVLLFDEVNIGVAMATPHGLVAPVIKRADRRSLTAIGTELARLRERASAFRLSPEDLHGGTFTISNLGMLGVERFVALINPPQAAILAVSALQTRTVWVGETPHPRKMGDLTLTADHRVLDGADAAAFLGSIKAALENPSALMA